MPEARQPGGPPAEPLSRAHLAVLCATFVLHAVVGWGCYSHSQIDTYQSAYLPVALASGQKLYAGAVYYFGPLAVEFYAVALRFTGIHLETLYALGLLTIVVATVLANKLLEQLELAPTARAATLLLFLTAFAFNNLYSVRLFNWVLPYCHSSTHACLAVLATSWLALKARRHTGPSQQRRAVIVAGLASSVAALNRPDLGLVLIALTTLYLGSSSYLAVALLPTVLVYAVYATIAGPRELLFDNLFWSGHNPWNNPHQQAIFGSAISLGAIAILLLIHFTAWHLARRYPRAALPLALAITAVVPAPSILLDIQALLLVLTLGHRFRRQETYLATLSLALLARILLKPTLNSYFFYLGPLPMLVLVALAWRRSTGQGQRALILGLLVFASANQARLNLHSFQAQTVRLCSPRGTLYLLPNPTSEALAPLLQALANSHPSTVLVLPEGTLINVLSGTRHPLAIPTLLPHVVGAMGEDALIEEIDEANPEAVVLLHRPTPEFGKAAFGQDYGKAILGHVQKSYPRVQRFGPPPFQSAGYESGGATLYQK